MTTQHSTVSHTPGPWLVETDETSDGSALLVIDRAGWRVVADCDGGAMGQESVEQAEANARLIAASPAILSALEGCADALREAGKGFALNNPHAARPNLYELHEQVARAAIAKAKGAQ